MIEIKLDDTGKGNLKIKSDDTVTELTLIIRVCAENIYKFWKEDVSAELPEAEKELFLKESFYDVIRGVLDAFGGK